MQLTKLLSPDTIRVGLPSKDKLEAINATVDLLKSAPEVADLERVRQVVLEREKAMSTGVGKGLGLPHGKTASMRDSVAALSVTSSPIDFDAFDGEPVQILFLLVGPLDAQTLHIRTLSRISRIMSNPQTRQDVLAAAGADEVYRIIVAAEKTLLAEDQH